MAVNMIYQMSFLSKKLELASSITYLLVVVLANSFLGSSLWVWYNIGIDIPFTALHKWNKHHIIAIIMLDE